MYYFALESGTESPFSYEFTLQQREMIAAIRVVIMTGDDQAIAASRGEGKTIIFERMLLKYTLNGVIGFSVLFAATGGLAEDSLDSIKAEIEKNVRLCADYPEVCVPVAALENTPNRAHYQLVSGRRHDNRRVYNRAPSKFSWCGQEIVFPNVPGSPSANAIIATRGLDSAIRGLKKKGRRVDVAGIDDPDTEETVCSEEQANKLKMRIDRVISGLGGQKRHCARVMLTTIQNRRCVSYQFTDPTQKPSWNGKRFRFLLKPPERMDLWNDYVQAKQGDWQKGTDTATELYVANRAEMERGAEVANPNRYTHGELSALQHYYNQVARLGQEAVSSEYDNDPPADDDIQRLVLTAYHVQNNCLSGLERGRVPVDTVAIAIGADVRKLGLDWVAVASDERGACCGIDYDFFEFQTEGKKAVDCEVLILEGLFDWHEALQKHPFLGPDGDPMFADLALIDAGWKEESWNAQPVQAFCSQVGFSSYVPSKGMSPYHRPKPARHIVLGDNWHWDAAQRMLFMNADHWKLKVHEGFLADDGQPGSIRLFDPPQVEGRRNRTFHLSYSKHILAETWETRFMPGFKGSRTGWWKSPKPNHKLDATYAALVGRSMRGISVFGPPVLPAATELPAAVAAAVERIETGGYVSPPRTRW